MDSTQKAVGRPDDTTPSVKKGKNYLLAIGIDAYRHHRSLNNAVKDATGFVDVMTQRFGFELLSPPLYNIEATQRNIQKAIGKCESLCETDRLIVFYSGHGWYKTAAKLGYLVPTEAQDDPNTDFISVSFILDIFKAVKAHHILLIVDCCFGGSFGMERNVHVKEMTEKVASELDTKKSRMVLSSGGIEPVSDGLVQANNSPFTEPLIAILKENKTEKLVISDIFPLLRKKTAWNTEQLPQYKVLQFLGHSDGEMALYCTDLESPEERAYKAAIANPNIPSLEKFLKDFNNSPYKPDIRKILKEKRAEAAWAKIENSRHIEKFDEFIDDFPDSPLVERAKAKIESLDIADTAPPQYSAPKIEVPTIIKPPKFDFEPEMVFVKGGTFRMGSDKGLENEKPIHDVTLSDFYIGKYPVTQSQWQAVMNNNPSYFKGDNLPVERVTWEDAQAFLKKLNAKTGKKYRLPIEAEWEYAARGGQNSKGFEYSGSNNIDAVAWYLENAENKTHPVGQKQANELGLYDMSGNVMEWCQDWYDENYYKTSPVTNPKGADKGDYRVCRGGSCSLFDLDYHVAYRYYSDPTDSSYVGFRVARYD